MSGPAPPSRTRWWTLAALLLAARTAALVLSVPESRPFTGDEAIYDSIARHLLAGEGYTHQGIPWVWRPPGWPVALAGLYAVLGTSLRPLVFVQGLFDAGTILALGWLASRMFGSEGAGRIAFLMLLVWPPLFRESRFLQTEPLFTLMTALTLCAYHRFDEQRTAGRGWLAGAAAGLAALVRPHGAVLVAGMVAGSLIGSRRPGARFLRQALPIAAALALVLAPWTLRNASRYHAFIPVSTGGGELFYMGTTPETDGRWDSEKWDVLTRKVLDPLRESSGRRLTPTERDRAFLRAGLENWRSDPAGSAVIAIKRFYRLCFVPVNTNDRAWLRWGFLATLLAVYALAATAGFAAARTSRAGSDAARILLATVVVYALASTLFYTSSRYFEPVRTLLLVMAAGGLDHLLRGGSRHGRAAASRDPRLAA